MGCEGKAYFKLEDTWERVKKLIWFFFLLMGIVSVERYTANNNNNKKIIRWAFVKANISSAYHVLY